MNQDKPIDTRTAEEILRVTPLSSRWNTPVQGNQGDELKPVLERLDNQEWAKPEAKNLLQEALKWQQNRINKDQVRQVISYEDTRILFFSFWRAYLPNQDFYLHPENIRTVQEILKWSIGDPESKIDLNRSIWLWGEIGAGKSVFASALHDLLDYLSQPRNGIDFKGRVWDFVDMNIEYDNAKFDPSAFRVLNTKNCLILDELKEKHFTIKTYGQENNIIGDFISARYSIWKKSNVRTLITTNLPPDFNDQAKMLDDREVDRMTEMFKSVEWAGKSLRK